MDPEIQSGFNIQESNSLKQKKVYKQYKEWLEAQGVLIDPSLIYPAVFGQQKNTYVGVSTSKVIPSGQAIIAVPYNLIITVPKVKEDSSLNKIIQENPNIFKYNNSNAFSILILYTCRQMIKGKDSIYYPYFAIADNISLVNWTHWDMLAVQNTSLTRQMKDQRQQIQQHFMAFLSIFRRYPNVFSEQLNNSQYKQFFQKAYNFVCTRAFGWSLPSISLIPMADSLNHNNDYVTHMLIDVKLQQSPPHQVYTLKHKKYNLSLLSKLYPQLPKNQPPARKKHRKQKFTQKHKQIITSSNENKKDGHSYILWQQYKAGVRNLRQLHFYDQSCQQDNDTDEETIQNLQFKLQQFRFYEKYETAGINQKNKQQQLIKYWSIFLDPCFQDEESDQQVKQKSKQQSTKHTLNSAQKIKQKFIAQSKQSEGSSLVSSSSSSDSDDEQFKWMTGNPESHTHASTYFIMATRKPIRKYQQIYNFYGRRSNRFLLIGYNFILDNNKYDSFAFRINIQNWKSGTNKKTFQTKTPVGKLINRDGKTTALFTRQIRIKKQRICIELINHCRALLIGWSDLKSQLANKKVRITIPFSIQFEKKVLSLALEFVRYFLKQYMTTLQEDQQLIQKAQKYQARLAIQMRINYKLILTEQEQLINKCQSSLAVWKNNKIDIKNQKQMKQLGKIRHYLCSLQRSKI